MENLRHSNLKCTLKPFVECKDDKARVILLETNRRRSINHALIIHFQAPSNQLPNTRRSTELCLLSSGHLDKHIINFPFSQRKSS